MRIYGDVPTAVAANQDWSMDFVHDQLADGRRFRVLTLIDQSSRESPLLQSRFSLTGGDVADALERLSCQRPLPKTTTVDHGIPITDRYQGALPNAQRSRLARYSRNNAMRIAIARRTRSCRSAVVAYRSRNCCGTLPWPSSSSVMRR